MIVCSAVLCASSVATIWVTRQIESAALAADRTNALARLRDLRIVGWTYGVLFLVFLGAGILLGVRSHWNQNLPFVLLGMGTASMVGGNLWVCWIYMKLARISEGHPRVRIFVYGHFALWVVSTWAYVFLAVGFMYALNG
jgi:hypothetical protein